MTGVLFLSIFSTLLNLKWSILGQGVKSLVLKGFGLPFERPIAPESFFVHIVVPETFALLQVYTEFATLNCFGLHFLLVLDIV